ncbi:SAE2-domain-containing protein [Hypomontagnella submonticulosa]|nr:SAE2-domain-containing protein [Hypomontagnella submonticulosa]
MGSWFRDVGRPALLEAVAGVCDRIDTEFGASLKSHTEENTRLSAELEGLRSRASDADRLEEEVLCLKKELQNFRDLSRADASSTGKPKSYNDLRNLRSPLAPKSVNQVSNPRRLAKSGNSNIDELKFSELKEEYQNLDGKYAKLHEKFSELEDAHAQLSQRLRDKTKAYDRWVIHAKQLDELCQKRSRKIKKLEAKYETAAAAGFGPLGTSVSSDTPDRPMSRPETVSDASKEIELPKSNFIPRDSPLIFPPSNAGGAGRESPRVSSLKQATTNHEPCIGQRDVTPGSESQFSTDDGEAPQLPPFPQNQDIHSRVVLVKNEPSSDTPVIVSERCLRKRKRDGEPEQATGAQAKVKIENSSNPLMIGEQHRFTAHESIDFDVGGNRVDTPRKRNRTNPELTDLSALNPVTTYSQTNDQASENLSSMPPLLAENNDRTSVGNGAARLSLDLQRDRSSALQPSNCNVMLRQRPGATYSTKRKDLSDLQTGIASLAEDGDVVEASNTHTSGRSKTGRLQGLLNTPSPGREAISVSSDVRPNHVRTSGAFVLPPRHVLSFGKSGMEKADEPAQTPNISEISNNQQTPMGRGGKRVPDTRISGGVTRKTKSLRERPKSELGLNDFKINPSVNEGYDYAFTDVVRNKDERASLVGCVDEACCGPTFRLQASAMRDRTSVVEFQALLENYLGDDAWKLSTMAKEEKEGLWLKAKTQELANEHGKHRHRFHRATSPIGYWRTGFPSTQEEQQDKEEAEKMTRRMIDDRYREAMRPGGRWLFRDE